MKGLLSLFIPLALAGCVGEAPIDDADASEAVAAEAGAPVDELHPCGKQTVAVVTDPSGVTISFCQLGEGVISVGENVPAGATSRLDGLGYADVTQACLGSVFRALAPGRPVPAVLDRCTAEELAVVPERSVAAQLTNSNYCAASGQDTFDAEQCGWMLTHYPHADARWCDSDLRGGTHLYDLADRVGDEGNFGRARMAACGGNVRFVAQWRWDVGDDFITQNQATVGAGGLYDWYIKYTGGIEDIDIRFAFVSNGGTYRSTGVFYDY